MDDLQVLERRVAGEVVAEIGPSEPVDDLAIYTSIVAATQSPKWRFQSMFSATKFVVAGAIVALFGGFLLAGVLMTQQDGETLPAVGASASASAWPEATTQPTVTRTDILPGVSLLTQEVEPGILRILADDAGHDLTEGHQDGGWTLLDLAISPDGTPWIADLEPEAADAPWFARRGGRLWALGRPGMHDLAAGEFWHDEQSALLAEPDGTITVVSGNDIFSLDGERFTPNPGSRQWETHQGSLWILDRDDLIAATGAEAGPRMSVRDPGALALFSPRRTGHGRWLFARDRGDYLLMPSDGPHGFSLWDLCGCGDHVRSEVAEVIEGLFFYEDIGDTQGSGPDAHYLADTYIDKLRLAPDGSIWAIGVRRDDIDGLYRIDPAAVTKP